MRKNNLDDFLSLPIQSLEIDTSEPLYHIDELVLEGITMEHHSLDVSFGSRKVSVTVNKGIWFSK